MRICFDRGTLLIEDSPEGIDLTRLPGIKWDFRVRAWRAPAFRHGVVVREIRRMGVRLWDDVAAPPRLAGVSHDFELRPYQNAALDAWDLSGRRGVIALPTGSGKTRTALAAVARCATATICMVPTRVLMDQWCAEIARLLRQDCRLIGRMGDGAYSVAPLTVATFESAYRHMAEVGHKFGLMVVDEAHHFGCGARDEALEMCVAPARLGLTATPPERGDQSENLAELVGPTVYQLGIQDLAGGFLADFDVVTILVKLTPEERLLYDAEIARFRPVLQRFAAERGRVEWQEFVKSAFKTVEGRRAMDAWHRARRLLAFPRNKAEALGRLLARHADSRTLIFTADNETAYAVSRAHLIMPITCEIPRREREDALSRFRSGHLRALVSARVLNEGLDVPDADVAVILGGTMGKREHVQRVGRVLRPARGKRALVYEIVVRDTGEMVQSRKRGEAIAATAAVALRG